MKLKPCPFCGGTDLLIKQAVIAEYHDETPFIVCEHCGFTIKVKELCIDLNLSAPENEDWWNNETAEKWNTRPVEDEMYRVLSGICFEKSARICDYAPESCKVCSINKALKKARGEK